MQGKVQITPVELSTGLADFLERRANDLRHGVNVQLFVDGRHCLLQHTQALTQILELGLIGLVVLVTPGGGFVVSHLRNDGLQNGQKGGGVLGSEGRVRLGDLAQVLKEVAHAGDDGGADLVVLIGEVAQDVREESLEQATGLLLALKGGGFLVQGADDVTDGDVDQLGDRFGEVGVVQGGETVLEERGAVRELRDNRVEVEEDNHVDLVLGLHLLTDDLREDVDGSIAHLLLAVAEVSLLRTRQLLE